MKYYSEKLSKLFDKKEELVNAEKEFDSKKEKEAAEIEKKKKEKEEFEKNRGIRFNELKKAYEEAYELKKKFLDDYGSIKYTITDKDIEPFNFNRFDFLNNIIGIFDSFKDDFWF